MGRSNMDKGIFVTIENIETTKFDGDKWIKLNLYAIAEKLRTDTKYGLLEKSGRDKAEVVAIIIENLGAMLDKMRYGTKQKEVEKYFVRTLAHLMTLSVFLDKPLLRGEQYKD